MLTATDNFNQSSGSFKMTASSGISEDLLAQILANCLSPDPNVRMNAELHLKQASSLAQFPVALLNLVFLSGQAQGTRQMAAVTLKNFIETHWYPKSERFVGPEPSPETKQFVRQNVLRGLSDPHASIRVAIVKDQIAHADWPEAWPNLFDDLMILLKSNNHGEVHGAMRVFAEFVKDDIVDSQFPHVAPILLPQLLAIFNNQSTYSPRMRAKAVAILQDFIELIFMVKEVHPEVIGLYIEPILSAWITPFKAVLEQALSQETLSIRHEVLQTLVKLMKQFPKQVTPYLQSMMDLLYRDFVNLCQEYEMALILPKAEDADLNDTEEIDSDGEILSISGQIYSLLALIRLVCPKKAFKAFFLSSAATKQPQTRHSHADNVLASIIRHLMIYMRITSTTESSWLNDIQQFIQDDEEDGLSYNVRVSAEETLQELLEAFPKASLESLLHIITQQVQEVMQPETRIAPSWWKIPEACFFAMSRFQSEVTESILSRQVQFDLSGFFSHIVVEAAKIPGAPFLQGRALCVASQYASDLPMEIVVICVESAVHLLRSTDVILPLRISALKSIRGFISLRSKSELISAQTSFLQALFEFAHVIQNMDVSQILIETLTLVIAINPGALSEYSALMTDFVGNIWRAGQNDMLFASLVNEFVGQLVENPSIALAMQTQLIPQWTETLTADLNVSTSSSLVTVALELLTVFMRKSSVSIPPTYAPHLYSNVFQVLLTAEESGVLQSGQELVKSLVEKDFASLAQWNENGRSGLEKLLDFIAKLLNPSQPESSSIFVGDLIIKIILKAGPSLTPVLPNLLHAVMERLECARMPSFIQTLIMVFARLMVDQFETVLGFLKSVTIRGRNGLDILLNAWCDNYMYLQGSYFIKLSVVILTKFFSCHDPDLQHLQVKGDLIVQQTKRIVTRSMAKDHPDEYTLVLFPAKVIKLLLNEYQNQLESAMKGASGKVGKDAKWIEEEYDEDDDEDDETGEWEDADDEDDMVRLANALGGEASLDEADEEDEDLMQDPIYQLDVKTHLVAFFKEGLANNTGHLKDIAQHILTDKEKNILLSISRI